MFGIEMFEIERCKIIYVRSYMYGSQYVPPRPPINQAPTNLPPSRTGKLSRPTNETYAKFRVFRE